MISDPIFYVAAVPAVILWGLSKGGFAGLSAFSLPLMAMVTSPVRAASIALPILIAQDVVSVWAYRRTWDKRNIAILLPPAVLGVAIGYYFAAQVSDAAFSVALGLISVLFAARRLIIESRAMPPKPATAKIAPGLFWGTLSGITSMIAHAG